MAKGTLPPSVQKRDYTQFHHKDTATINKLPAEGECDGNITTTIKHRFPFIGPKQKVLCTLMNDITVWV